MQHRPLNILFLVSWYPSETNATLGNFVQRHAEAVALKHKVMVVGAFEADHPRVDILQNGENLTEVRVYFVKKTPVVSYYKAMKKGLRVIGKYITGGFDLTHIHVAYPAGLLKPKGPYVVTEHFSGYHPQSGFQWGRFKKMRTLRTLNRAGRVLPVSRHLGEALRQFGVSVPMEKISNVVDPDVFYPGRRKSNRFTFLHVSTLEERSKNITGILKGFKRLEEAGFDFVLKIGGDGDLDTLREKVTTYGPSSRSIEIFGEKPLSEIADLMRESHAYVMFSHFENQPTTILEALCCGVPVISSDVGGISEELSPENGILIPAEDETAFVEGLKDLMTNYRRFHPQEIAKAARARYSYRAVSEQLTEVYFSVLSSGASGPGSPGSVKKQTPPRN